MTLRGLFLVVGILGLLLALVLNCGDSLGPAIDSSLFDEPEQPILHTTRTAWHPAAKPAQLGGDYVRGKILWHTPRDLVSVDDVWDREAAQGQGTVKTLRMFFRPRHFQTDTTIVGDQLVVDTIATGLKSWAGITTYLGKWGYYIHDTTQFFEIRARARSGRMHVEFGRISEDTDGDAMVDTEDGIATNGARNGICEEEEDVGLDGLADPDESQFYDYVKHETVDPAGDNWYFLGDGKCPLPDNQCERIDWDNETIRYEWLNGTEGNIDDPSVQGRPDDELLSWSGFNMVNSYFPYVIDFESDSFRVPDSDWPHEVSEDQRWWTYRLPLRDTAAMGEIVDVDGSPDWTHITHARVWFEDETTDDLKWDTVEIADWGFLQEEIGPEPQPDSSASFIRDYEFARGRIFDLIYPGEFEPEDSVIDLIVFEVPVNQQDVSDVVPATLYVDPDDPSAYPAERVTGIFVKEVEGGVYHFYNDAENNRHYVVFNSEKGRRGALGAWLKVKRYQQQDTVVIGDLTGATLALRLLRRPGGVATDRSWQLMWRNCYAVPRGVALEYLHLSVRKGLPGDETSDSNKDYQEIGGLTQSYLEILGLDQYNQLGQKFADGYVDDRVEIYRPDWGLVIFPHREPFNSDTTYEDSAGNKTMPLAETVGEIYLYGSWYNHSGHSLYFLRTVQYQPPDRPY